MGHIPTSESTNLMHLSFHDALREAKKPQQTYDVSKWLFVPPYYDEYRYVLGTLGEHPLICCGINPSTAAPDNLDNTLKSVQRIAQANGFDSFLMFNVYAQRATYPEDMDKVVNADLDKQNMNAFAYLLKLAGQNGRKPTVWAAWGNIIETRSYLKDCVREMVRITNSYGGADWVHAGTISKKGHPHHPLYLKKDSKLEMFDMDTYLKE